MLGLPFRYWLKHPMTCVADVVSDPLELWELMRDTYAHNRERAQPACEYVADPDWERQLHASLGVPFPCGATGDFRELWPKIMEELEQRGIRPGPESFQANNDGDAGFVRTIWCLIHHLKPRRILETGVAHGVTSRFVLEALARTGGGHLWSIDFPPFERELRQEIGAAVGGRFADRWTFISGSSRRRLPKVLSAIGAIDVFIHDSLHSTRNVSFELDQVWPALKPQGIAVVDDIDVNWGFHAFREQHSVAQSLVCEAEPVRPDIRRFNQKGLFGILQKPAR